MKIEDENLVKLHRFLVLKEAKLKKLLLQNDFYFENVIEYGDSLDIRINN